MAFDEQAAIAEFWAARVRGEFFPPAWFDRLSLDQAYRIQLGLIARRCAGGGERQIGWKIGVTAKAIQEQFHVHEPVFGCILERVETGHVFRAEELIRPGFEPELCLRLGHDLGEGVTLAAAAAAVDACFPALEIIETRGDFSRQLALALADNAQQKTIVLGAPVPLAGLDPPLVEARVAINGTEAATGRGAAVLGNPLNSIVWLAGKLADYGRSLRAGEFIMTGSFTRQFPLAAGDRVRVEFSGVGAVQAAIRAADRPD